MTSKSLTFARHILKNMDNVITVSDGKLGLIWGSINAESGHRFIQYVTL